MEKHLGSVKLGTIIEEFKLEVLFKGENYENIPLQTLDTNRPGLPLAGYYEYFDTQRLLVMGITEYSYCQSLSSEARRAAFDRLFSHAFPALIVTRGLKLTPECMAMAEKHKATVLRTEEETSRFMSRLISSLADHLSPKITRSGVMLEVYGEGILIQGESGVGKSEVAIEMIKRGHRLIADDAVEIKVKRNMLEATSPELIRHYMELRGIGVIDVRRLFGMGAIKMEQNIDLVVQMEPWDDSAVYDRLGLEGNRTEIMGVEVPMVVIPVKPGRNLASILEVAAMNNRNRKMGHNAALELTRRMDAHFQQITNEALMGVEG